VLYQVDTNSYFNEKSKLINENVIWSNLGKTNYFGNKSLIGG